jgi:hypothetical protein
MATLTEVGEADTSATRRPLNQSIVIGTSVTAAGAFPIDSGHGPPALRAHDRGG